MKDLVEELDDFLSIEKRMDELKHREESRVAMEHMLDLITQIADYICAHTSKIRGPLSSLVSLTLSDYYRAVQLFLAKLKKKIEEFKKEFARAKELFDCGVDIETYCKVLKLGECSRYIQCTWPYCNYRAR